MIYFIGGAAAWFAASYWLFWRMHYIWIEQFGSADRGSALLHAFAAFVLPAGCAIVFFENPRVRAWMRREWP